MGGLAFFSSLALVAATLATAAPPRAVDGDTVEIAGETIRLPNIDTPEIGQAKCASERERGVAAKARMQQLLRRGRITILRGDHGRQVDKYGRTLGRVLVDGQDLGEILITEGHARRWTGKRRPWCHNGEEKNNGKE